MIAIDAQGFFIRGKFYIAELSFYNHMFNNHHIFNINMPKMTKGERKTVRYVANQVHGLSPYQEGLCVNPQNILRDVSRSTGETFVTNNKHLHRLLKRMGISVSLSGVTNKVLSEMYKYNDRCHNHSFAGLCSQDKVKKLYFYHTNGSIAESFSQME